MLISHHAPIAGRIAQPGRDNRPACSQFVTVIQKRAQRWRREQRSIAVEYQQLPVCLADGVSRAEYSVSRALLLGLFGKTNSRYMTV